MSVSSFKTVTIVSDHSLAEELYYSYIVLVVCKHCCVFKHKNGAFTKCFFLFILFYARVCVSVYVG